MLTNPELVRELKDLLRDISDGRCSFEPTDRSKEALEQFQRKFKLLQYAKEQGLIEDFRARQSRRDLHRLANSVEVRGGLTVQGEEYLYSQSIEQTTSQSISGEKRMEKIKVLFLAANPNGTTPLALDEEARAIENKIRMAEHRDSVEFITKWAVRPDDLQQSLLQHQPHVVHFSGHGIDSDEIILLDENRNPKPVSGIALAGLLSSLKDNIRVVVLNACYSQSQAKAIAEHIDVTIGMNTAIGDEAAIIFAGSFYRAIGFGRSVQNAFELGKNALMLEGIPEENTPEMFIRTNISSDDVCIITPPN